MYYTGIDSMIHKEVFSARHLHPRKMRQAHDSTDPRIIALSTPNIVVATAKVRLDTGGIMKHLITRSTLPFTPLAALVALTFLPALLQAQTLTLDAADTVEAEFRVGGAGKIAVTFMCVTCCLSEPS